MFDDSERVRFTYPVKKFTTTGILKEDELKITIFPPTIETYDVGIVQQAVNADFFLYCVGCIGVLLQINYFHGNCLTCHSIYQQFHPVDIRTSYNE